MILQEEEPGLWTQTALFKFKVTLSCCRSLSKQQWLQFCEPQIPGK